MSNKGFYFLSLVSSLLLSLLYPTTVLASWVIIGQNDQYKNIYIENKSVKINGDLRSVRAHLPTIGYAAVAVNCYSKEYVIIDSEGVNVSDGLAPRSTVIGVLLEEICENYVPIN